MTTPSSHNSALSCKAACQIVGSGSNTTMGTLSLSQTGDKVQITGTLTGLGGSAGKRGISVCTYGNLSSGAQSCGSIFNPFGAFCCCCYHTFLFLVFFSTTTPEIEHENDKMI